ncbi:hypothetical protein ABZZ74_50950 [Streptomyces sp. NPDC006476]|uniref:hypothetical protein n=1 Tax=Streptomyces sp. NPDC006476 TaxID=3157175 RepID=UPI0033A08116
MIPRELLKEAVNKLGTAGRSIGVRDMAKHIDRKLGEDGASKLYDLVYAPTSNHFTTLTPDRSSDTCGRTTS